MSQSQRVHGGDVAEPGTDFALAEDVSEVALQGGVGRGEEDERRVASRGAGAEEEGEGGVRRGESMAADTSESVGLEDVSPAAIIVPKATISDVCELAKAEDWTALLNMISAHPLLLNQCNDADENKGGLLHIAATKESSVAFVQDLIKRGATVDIRDQEGKTPLHYACDCRHVSFAKVLLEHGSNVVCEDNDGATPLHWACDKVNVALATVLLEHGADINAKTNVSGFFHPNN